ncbi:MAG: DUF177 domain-containing protein [Proteobacteria bacterium]|nr:DUF177 domain-containing protein [Cystobacterineae bacterium]MCL2258311.1 DUF177 domain-containing protein [Cystobacterineae bacterium]MCL2315085.1 DUF177 domain-containing protein [Pseudomonadota bacterium]
MFVRIEEIQEPSLKLQRELSPAYLDEVFEEVGGVSWRSASLLSARLQRVGGEVFLEAELSLQLRTGCARCLEEVEFPLAVSFSATFIAQADYEEALKQLGQVEDWEGAGSFHMAFADIEPFDGKVISLSLLVKEQILLALPISVLCSENCKGLCATCGSNYNLKGCECEQEFVDLRLAKLKEINLSKGKT